ncbi:retinol dehydrogenase 11-like isoform X2 [Littorina saxatilis]|uniref:retinol dehydrogenase 11-like isoform X2 n=1 Tax=Littorina saxatilis TaxID=31220 RepID=UPI0038B572E2
MGVDEVLHIEWGLPLPPVWMGVAAGVATLLVVLVKWNKAKRCTDSTDLRGKTVIITGANTGIGFSTARDLAARDAKVILACRSKERGEAARQDIVVATGNKNVVVRQLDLFDFESVRQFAEQILREEDRLDILINNAAIFGLPQPPSKHGLEVTMAINHFGHFLLTLLLLDLLKKSAPSRVITVSSGANGMDKKVGIDFSNLHCERAQSQFARYAASKLANIFFTRELARRLHGTGVTAYCLHPGFVSTHIGRNLGAFSKSLLWALSSVIRSGDEGSQTSIFLAVSI